LGAKFALRFVLKDVELNPIAFVALSIGILQQVRKQYADQDKNHNANAGNTS
jgi:hypothetical protein